MSRIDPPEPAGVPGHRNVAVVAVVSKLLHRLHAPLPKQGDDMLVELTGLHHLFSAAGRHHTDNGLLVLAASGWATYGTNSCPGGPVVFSAAAQGNTWWPAKEGEPTVG